MSLYTSTAYGVNCDICRRFCPQAIGQPSKKEAKAAAVNVGFTFLENDSDAKAVCPDCQQLLLRAAVCNSSSKRRWRVRSFLLVEQDERGEAIFQSNISIPPASSHLK
jgi:hypothetical protein